MAHDINVMDMEEACPRCGTKKVRVATYYFGSTFHAECSHCAFGFVKGCNVEMAIARYRGKIMEAAPEV